MSERAFLLELCSLWCLTSDTPENQMTHDALSLCNAESALGLLSEIQKAEITLREDCIMCDK